MLDIHVLLSKFFKGFSRDTKIMKITEKTHAKVNIHKGKFGPQKKKKGRQRAQGSNLRPKKAGEAGSLPPHSFHESINTHPAMNRRHVKMSNSCKHRVHHDLAIPTGVVSIKNLCCRMAQESRRGEKKSNMFVI